jgi:cytochrome c peroxidase
MIRRLSAVAVLLVVLLQSCSKVDDETYRWALPDGYPEPAVPDDNPMSAVKVELGRWLFYDPRLSVNNSLSCAGCHRQSLSFTDGLAASIGATGEKHPRSAMSLLNVAYASRLTWANHLLARLEFQALTPLFGEQPVEMGMAGREDAIVRLIRDQAPYAELFPQAFPTDSDPYSVLNAVRAIGSFVRSIVSFDTPYDRYAAGDADAMSDSQVRGMELFFSERIECFHCHGGFNFSDSSTHASAAIENVGFHNTGLYNLENAGAYPADNTGLYDLTGQRRDMGRFRAPSLRNVALTAPYMHDGSIPTLDGVLDHYAAGGRTIAEGEWAGEGHRNPFKSEFVPGFTLSATERADLLRFLHALSDESVLGNPRFSDPHADH